MNDQYVLLLRGVNVGAKNQLPMAELRAMLERVGCTDIATYIQSGNAVLRSPLAEAPLTAAIEQELAGYMGRAIDTTLRTRGELERVIATNPFATRAAQPKDTCVTFLSQVPAFEVLAPLEATDWLPEQYLVDGPEIYAWYPNGQGRSALATAVGKLKLAGTVTTRNFNTVLKLHAMLG